MIAFILVKRYVKTFSENVEQWCGTQGTNMAVPGINKHKSAITCHWSQHGRHRQLGDTGTEDAKEMTGTPPSVTLGRCCHQRLTEKSSYQKPCSIFYIFIILKSIPWATWLAQSVQHMACEFESHLGCRIYLEGRREGREGKEAERERESRRKEKYS